MFFVSILDIDFCKPGQVRSPDFHLNQQHQEEEDEALCSRTAAHMHSRGYSLGVGSDMDTEPEVEPSPNHGLQHMWMRGLKSEQSSCLTSRANSALSLTDTEHDRKSEPDNGEYDFVFLKETVYHCKDKQSELTSAALQQVPFLFRQHWWKSACLQNFLVASNNKTLSWS